MRVLKDITMGEFGGIVKIFKSGGDDWEKRAAEMADFLWKHQILGDTAIGLAEHAGRLMNELGDLIYAANRLNCNNLTIFNEIPNILMNSHNDPELAGMRLNDIFVSTGRRKTDADAMWEMAMALKGGDDGMKIKEWDGDLIAETIKEAVENGGVLD